jgi:hypothetical protein
MRVIVSTMPDQSVAITYPTAQALMLLQYGGGIPCVAHSPRHGVERLGLQAWLRSKVDIKTQLWFERTAYLPLELAKAWEVEKHVREPNWRPDRPAHARQLIASLYVEALAHGGLSEEEAIALLAERDAPSFAQAIEIMDADVLPPNRIHRNAWRRSNNGGPIYIDDVRAQMIDETRMWNAYKAKPEEHLTNAH